MTTPNAIIKLLEDRNDHFVVGDSGIVYVKRGHQTEPLCAANINTNLDNGQIKKLLKKQKTLIFRASSGFELAMNLPYYSVICKKNVAIEMLKSNEKRKFNKALNTYKVQRIEPGRLLLPDALHTMHQANLRYGSGAQKINIDKLQRQAIADAKNPDAVHYWAAIDDKNTMAAYCCAYIFEKIEANYKVICFNPDDFKNYVSHALFYTMNDYYLTQQNFSYVNDGYKTLTGHSGIQDFLVNYFNFEMQPTKLIFECTELLNMGIKIAMPFEKIIKNTNIQAVFNAKKIIKIQN